MPEAPKPAAAPPPLSKSLPKTAAAPAARFSPEVRETSGGFARVGYLLSAALLIPLVFSLLSKDDDVKQRIEATAQHHPEVFQKLDADKDATVEDLFEALPEHKFEGAFLPRETAVHWLFALMSAIGFFVLAWFFFERGGASAMHLVFAAAFTATVGIASLLMFQFAADFTQGVWVRGRGIVTLLFYIVKFIGFSYNAASDPEAGFWLSFLGFTCGVGLCEELTKAAPLLSRMGKMDALGWRGMCLWGLASGIGFGVAEGIMYSANHYNGIATPGIYMVRFVSCVGLHAIWSAAVGIAIWKDRELFDSNDLGELVVPLLKAIAVPMILHGLYDTTLKRDMNLYALLVAGVSFAWMVWQIELARSQDDESESYTAEPARA
jgi:RsiW-degrading membrane proteinase PrsW (M82 family)